MIRKRYDFTGQVQHVGFRWRARKAADLFSCTGWCRNNENGSVTMEIQGSRIRVVLVLLAIRSSRRIHIQNTVVTRLVPDRNEGGFNSKY